MHHPQVKKLMLINNHYNLYLANCIVGIVQPGVCCIMQQHAKALSLFEVVFPEEIQVAVVFFLAVKNRVIFD